MSGRRSPLGVLFLTVFLDLVGFGIVLPLLPRFAAEYQAERWQIGLLMATYSLMQFFFSPLWGRLSDRIGRRPVLLLSITGSAVSYLLFALAPNLPMLFVSRVLAGIMAANIGTAQAYIADITTPE
ncbi:MAG: TCR/Tet family MFS transporter, partial [Armatimonadetes bacterium]|nr:TCR/Tet family MFS transporter [Armatimonadota bacterium]